MQYYYAFLLSLMLTLAGKYPATATALPLSCDTIPATDGVILSTKAVNDQQSAPMIPLAFNTGDWTSIGQTQEGAPPYGLYYYKLLQINLSTHRYASILEVSVQADANYYYMQGTYRIRVDKFESTPGRFDGLEVQCISGNPTVATFYIYNNAVWVRSNYQWGGIYYRTVADFTGASPLGAAPFGQTLTAPTGYAVSTTNVGVKCDFDNNQYYSLPFVDINGSSYFYNNVQLYHSKHLGIGLNDQFTYDNKPQPHYGLQWTADSWTGAGPTFWLSAYGGMKFFTQGVPRMVLTGTGNVGIGTTNPQSKLAVKGDIFATKVKVTQTGWPDYVFHKDHKLPSLREIESFIEEHQHLPEVPTADEIEKNGLDVGEMNKKLLQKVEELTLYLLQQQKLIEAQDKRIQQLEDKQR